MVSVNIALLAITIAGPVAVGMMGILAGCARLSAVMGITTAIYIGAESNDPFYSSLVFGLLSLAAIGISIRVGFRMVGR